jgi:hypothetical protein
MRHEGKLGKLEAALAADPTNLDLAWRYWKALGSWNGYDIRAGMYVFQAFRAAALKAPAGVLAFARAYRELFVLSGEPPQELGPELSQAAEAALDILPSDDCADVQWLLDSVGRRRHRAC